MKRNISIQLKAALLLIVFSMNTAIGFACAVGVDMGFNSKHHDDDDEEVTEAIHIHTGGARHLHHDESDKHYHDTKEDSENDGCCNHDVVKFQDLDKTLAKNINYTIPVPVFVAVLNSFSATTPLNYSYIPSKKLILHFFHPPPDIRILIQSFQI